MLLLPSLRPVFDYQLAHKVDMSRIVSSGTVPLAPSFVHQFRYTMSHSASLVPFPFGSLFNTNITTPPWGTPRIPPTLSLPLPQHYNHPSPKTTKPPVQRPSHVAIELLMPSLLTLLFMLLLLLLPPLLLPLLLQCGTVPSTIFEAFRQSKAPCNGFTSGQNQHDSISKYHDLPVINGAPVPPRHSFGW